ncbi:MAG: GNAT family N-acetyltransferase [Bacteroidia bacterium]|jgi:RimJ/RimL family protein N-acetyltransferase
MKIFAETERLILREIVPEDEAALFELDSDPAVHTFLGNNPVTHTEQIREIILFIRRQYEAFGIGRWAMIEKTTGAFLGWSGLKYITETTNNHIHYYDLGYRLMRKYWGKGYATESALASVEYGFTILKQQRLYAATHHLNQNSMHVLQKCGFRLWGTYEDYGALQNWFVLTREDWESRMKT